MSGKGMGQKARGAAIGIAAFAVLLTIGTAERPLADVERGGAPATLALDLTLDLGAAGAALRLRL
ncbi:MAG: hypothetical protein ACK40O_08310 [Allosphingosinicella sp.]